MALEGFIFFQESTDSRIAHLSLEPIRHMHESSGHIQLHPRRVQAKRHNENSGQLTEGFKLNLIGLGSDCR